MPEPATLSRECPDYPVLCADGPSWVQVLRAGTRAIACIGDDIGVFGQSAADLLEALDGTEIIDLAINSRGGDSNCALELHRALKGRVRTATIKHRCHSAAVTIALCASHVEIERQAKVMIHQPCVACYGRAEDLHFAASGVERTTREISAVLQAKTRQPADVIAGWLDGHDHYFDAEQALTLGLVDSIFDMPAMPQEVTAPVAPDLGPTDDEKIFSDFLSAFGDLKVRDRKTFARDVNAWLAFNVRE